MQVLACRSVRLEKTIYGFQMFFAAIVRIVLEITPEQQWLPSNHSKVSGLHPLSCLFTISLLYTKCPPFCSHACKWLACLTNTIRTVLTTFKCAYIYYYTSQYILILLYAHKYTYSSIVAKFMSLHACIRTDCCILVLHSITGSTTHFAACRSQQCT